MMALELITWWYGQGWKLVVSNAKLRLLKVSGMFSVPILMRTLLSPWRRIVTYPGASLDDRVRALGDNMVSRMVGFTVRIMVLFSAGVMLALTAVASGVMIVAWPLVPPAILVLLALGVLA